MGGTKGRDDGMTHTEKSLQGWDLGIMVNEEFRKTGRTKSRKIRDAHLKKQTGEIMAYWERWDDGCQGSNAVTE